MKSLTTALLLALTAGLFACSSDEPEQAQDEEASSFEMEIDSDDGTVRVEQEEGNTDDDESDG